MSDSPSAVAASSSPTREPPVIGRLPTGVEYTHVKQIVLGLPGALDVLAWFTTGENNGLGWSRFRGKIFRALDRVLRREEQRLLTAAPEERGRNEQGTAMLRHQFIQYFRLALQQRDPTGERRWLSTSFVAPSQAPSATTPSDPSRRDLVIEVREPAKGGPRLLVRVVMPPGPPGRHPSGVLRPLVGRSSLRRRMPSPLSRGDASTDRPGLVVQAAVVDRLAHAHALRDPDVVRLPASVLSRPQLSEGAKLPHVRALPAPALPGHQRHPANGGAASRPRPDGGAGPGCGAAIPAACPS